RRGYPLLEMAAHGLEFGRPRALEAEDRLLLVADGEDGAHLAAGAVAGEELLGEGLDHLPLAGTGVLGLVYQDVVEAAVELVEHPGGLRALEQLDGAGDQIVVVEDGVTALGRLVTGK